MTVHGHGQGRALDLISIEDSVFDAEMLADALGEAGLTTILRYVDDEQTFRAALDECLPDAILSDWALPHFSGRRAMAIAHDRCPGVPFIFVSGTISESSAIEALRQGAIDFVYKHQLQRLGPVLTRALGEARMIASLRESEALNRAVLDSVEAEIAVLDHDGIIIAVNEPWRHFSLENSSIPGQATPNTGVGTDYLATCRDRASPASDGARDASAGIQGVRDGRLATFSIEYSCHSPEKERWFILSATPLDQERRGVVVTHVEVTERRLAEDKIQLLAYYDNLTGLINRRLLLDRLKQAVMANSRSGSHGALLYFDLDNFKIINDTLGHDAGDLLLKKVAQRLTACVRENDTVARLGGDEFVVMLANLTVNKAEAASQADAIAEQILAKLNEPYLIQDGHYHCTASIGATLFQGQIATEELLKQADLAMYKAKAAGRNALRFFDPDLEAAMTARAWLETELRGAMRHDHLLLHYQPQIRNGCVAGAEALVRWQHPQRGIISPGEFIPLAEEIGLILPLGKWVLETACRQLAKWATQSEMANLSISVNVSAYQFRRTDFVSEVLSVLKSSGADARRLKLELTESMLIKDVEQIVEKMLILKAEGVYFSLDDFGTGYSSLSYLQRLPLDELKIDQSFVHDVLTDPNAAAIARTVIALAQNLGLAVVAEGVETEAQWDFLLDSGCPAFQGFFFSRPLSVEDFEQYVQRVGAPSARQWQLPFGFLPKTADSGEPRAVGIAYPIRHRQNGR